ncbi:MAG: hypothetical protein CSA32_01205 [Desulfobulbus propionicus]|nr:MAG: hypothetical protein CSA32_01205 [Desulfobulbus propionicus]
MKKMINIGICLFLSILLGACAGPGTGPNGTYTESDRQRDQANTALAVGLGAIGAAALGSAIYEAGKNDASRPQAGSPHPAPHGPRLKPAVHRKPLR